MAQEDDETQFGYPVYPAAHELQLAPVNPVLHTHSFDALQVPWPLHVVAGSQAPAQFGYPV